GERGRVLQGIRLSENVVNRMKEPGQPSRVGLLAPPAAALGSSGGREKDSKPPRPDCGSGRGPLRVQVDPLERCDWEQAVLQDELVRVATTEREAAASPRSVTLRRGEGGVDQEKQRLAQRVSAGPQTALLAPLVQGAEVEPWTCISVPREDTLGGASSLQCRCGFLSMKGSFRVKTALDVWVDGALCQRAEPTGPEAAFSAGAPTPGRRSELLRVDAWPPRVRVPDPTFMYLKHTPPASHPVLFRRGLQASRAGQTPEDPLMPHDARSFAGLERGFHLREFTAESSPDGSLVRAGALPVFKGPEVWVALPTWVCEDGENPATLLLLTPSPRAGRPALGAGTHSALLCEAPGVTTQSPAVGRAPGDTPKPCRGPWVLGAGRLASWRAIHSSLGGPGTAVTSVTSAQSQGVFLPPRGHGCAGTWSGGL
ncbi:PREDICTED: uncharacterized protein LOC104981574, partial [Bison bison bison]|uniref:Uncharacterized protein LOC104981574 n=1 Tax=Bison bison bison TaxID=43346 RepID=A0A6P3GQB5_BISBB